MIPPIVWLLTGLGFYVEGMTASDKDGPWMKWVFIVTGIIFLVLWTHVVGVDQ